MCSHSTNVCVFVIRRHCQVVMMCSLPPTFKTTEGTVQQSDKVSSRLCIPLLLLCGLHSVSPHLLSERRSQTSRESNAGARSAHLFNTHLDPHRLLYQRVLVFSPLLQQAPFFLHRARPQRPDRVPVAQAHARVVTCQIVSQLRQLQGPVVELAATGRGCAASGTFPQRTSTERSAPLAAS